MVLLVMSLFALPAPLGMERAAHLLIPIALKAEQLDMKTRAARAAQQARSYANGGSSGPFSTADGKFRMPTLTEAFVSSPDWPSGAPQGYPALPQPRREVAITGTQGAGAAAAATRDSSSREPQRERLWGRELQAEAVQSSALGSPSHRRAVESVGAVAASAKNTTTTLQDTGGAGAGVGGNLAGGSLGMDALTNPWAALAC